METAASVQWLKENNLHEMAKGISQNLKQVFTDCLCVKDEKILVVGDGGYQKKQVSSLLSGAYYIAADELRLNTKLVIQNAKPGDEEAEEDVVKALSELDDGDVVLLNLSDKLGSLGEFGKSFRSYCKKRKFRFVSASSLGDLETSKVTDVIKAININYKSLQLKQDGIKQILDKADEMKIKTKAGTELYAEIKGCAALSSDGNYSSDGTGGNLPCGEVYIAPTKKVSGVVVIDGSTRNHKHTNIIKDPIRLVIEEGKVISIEGKEEAELLERTIEWASQHSKKAGSVRRIGEIGIGFNPNARIIGSTLVDEKVLGTAHIGIGSNYWFGGDVYSIIHLDQIFKDPEIEVDGEKLKI